VRLVYQHKIGCLPVVDEARNLKGILTVVDMLAALIDLMGFLSESSRLDLVLPEQPEAFEEVSHIIQKNGAKIINISLSRPSDGRQVYLFRLEKMNLDPIIHDLQLKGYEIISRLD